MKAPVLALTIFAALALKAHAVDIRYAASDFTKVTSKAGVEVTVVEGYDYRIEAIAERGSIKRLIVRQDGDTLVISRKSSGMAWGLIDTFRKDRFEVTVALPALEEVTALSGSTMHVTSDDNARFDAHVGQGATLHVQGLGGGEVDASARSGSTLVLAGDCGALKVEARSGATVDAADLRCETVAATSRSGASINAFAQDEAEGNARAGSSILIAGNPAHHDFQVSTGGSARLR